MARCSSAHFCSVILLLGILVSGWGWERCDGLRTFSFDIHHRFSDRVRDMLAVDGLPDKDTVGYYRVMAHRDRFIKGRRLTSNSDHTPLTFSEGNETLRVDILGFLHYANVSVGTPAEWFLVALDTGSDLFWLPCDCSNCLHGLNITRGTRVNLNIYSPTSSSTSSKVPCNSSICTRADKCSSNLSSCPYQVRYLSNGTSSTGYLVEDVLCLITDDEKPKAVDAKVTLGCGQVQTGVFRDGAAPNGLFGLGINNISVPSVLAKAGITSNSFSLCFGHDGIGRIRFGDSGSHEQRETPLNVKHSHPTYNISITQVIVGDNVADLEFSAVFDSGTSFTYLSDPVYTLFTESFNSLAQDKRFPGGADIPFEYCYEIRPNQESFEYPAVNLTMKGGGSYPVYRPLAVLSLDDVAVYCLAIIKSEDISIVGQNFMTGYRMVFDRERMVLGWKESDCYERTSGVPAGPPKSSAQPPVATFNPEATNVEKGSSLLAGPPFASTLILVVALSVLALL